MTFVLSSKVTSLVNRGYSRLPDLPAGSPFRPEMLATAVMLPRIVRSGTASAKSSLGVEDISMRLSLNLVSGIYLNQALR